MSHTQPTSPVPDLDAHGVERVAPGDPAQIAAQLSDHFLAEHGQPPQVVATAPGRVNLIGEHTDYNGGLALPMALPHATYVAAGPRTDRRLEVRSLQQAEPISLHLDYLEPTLLDGWAAYVAGTVWALEDILGFIPGMNMVIDGRVPLSAGLSSSAALECAVALATCEVAGVKVADVWDGSSGEEQRQSLVEACMLAESEAAGAPTGGMDQTISLLAIDEHALLMDCRDWTVEQIAWRLPGVTLLVVDTRVAHANSDGQYAARRTDCDKAARELGVDLLRDVVDPAAALGLLSSDVLRARARHVFSENTRVSAAAAALRDGDVVELGRLFVDSHESLRDDYEVSAPELDLVVDTAVAAGAYGARMTGGGFGGSAIVLVGNDRLSVVEVAIRSAFEAAAMGRPGFLIGRPSPGARILHLTDPPRRPRDSANSDLRGDAAPPEPGAQW